MKMTCKESNTVVPKEFCYDSPNQVDAVQVIRRRLIRPVLALYATSDAGAGGPGAMAAAGPDYEVSYRHPTPQLCLSCDIVAGHWGFEA